jgi:PhnB protein
MAERNLSEQLDLAVQATLSQPDSALDIDVKLKPLLEIATGLRYLPRPDFRASLKSALERRTIMQSAIETVQQLKTGPVPKGYRAVTPYLVAEDGPGLIDFAKHVFAAEELFRTVGSAGGIHCEVRIGDSMAMIGGGRPGHEFRSKPAPAALHVYVKDTDAVYERALAAGATPISPPADQEYGERGAGVRDPFGNYWYIATAFGKNYLPAGLHNVNPYLHPVRAPRMIEFLGQAFDAKPDAIYQSPDGVVHHARVKIGDSMIEMGEAHGPYQPMASMFYLYVKDCDALYAQAIRAGATSIAEPEDHPYGDRSGGVRDPFGNQWYIATHIKDV